MLTLKEDAERILNDALITLSKVQRDQAPKEEVIVRLKDIIQLAHQIISKETEALRRVEADVNSILEEGQRETLKKVGVDLEKLFG